MLFCLWRDPRQLLGHEFVYFGSVSKGFCLPVGRIAPCLSGLFLALSFCASLFKFCHQGQTLLARGFRAEFRVTDVAALSVSTWPRHVGHSILVVCARAAFLGNGLL